MRDYFTGAGNAAGTPTLRMLGEPGGGLAEELVHFDGGTRAIGGDVIEDLGAIVFRLRRPGEQ